MPSFGKKQFEESIVLETLIKTDLITPLDLEEADQAFISSELKWLFSAADHLLKICRDEVDRSQAVPVPVPAEAERSPEANNRLLDRPKNSIFEDTKDWHGQVDTRWQRNVEVWLESQLRQINTYLRNLKRLLARETELGAASKGDLRLQNTIRTVQLQIANTLQELAELMNDAYGILVTSPGQLVEYLEDQ